MKFKFRLINRVPIVEMDGKTCLLDTGFPGATMPVSAGVQEFFGIPGLFVAGTQSLKRYPKFNYPNSEITTSDDPIPLEGGMAVHLELRSFDGEVAYTGMSRPVNPFHESVQVWMRCERR